MTVAAIALGDVGDTRTVTAVRRAKTIDGMEEEAYLVNGKEKKKKKKVSATRAPGSEDMPEVQPLQGGVA